MAHRKNPRSLRQNLWRNPVFCQYIRNQQSRNSWTKSLQRMHVLSDFFRKLSVQKKKRSSQKKKKTPL